MEAMMKHSDCPAADIISRERRPYLSTVCETQSDAVMLTITDERTQSGMKEATMYVHAVAPPSISDKFLDRPIVFW